MAELYTPNSNPNVKFVIVNENNGDKLDEVELKDGQVIFFLSEDVTSVPNAIYMDYKGLNGALIRNKVGGSNPIDEELSETSENPLANHAIYDALANKINYSALIDTIEEYNRIVEEQEEGHVVDALTIEQIINNVIVDKIEDDYQNIISNPSTEKIPSTKAIKDMFKTANVLWTGSFNPNNTTIELSSSDYDYLEVIPFSFVDGTTVQGISDNSNLTPKGSSIRLSLNYMTFGSSSSATKCYIANRDLIYVDSRHYRVDFANYQTASGSGTMTMSKETTIGTKAPLGAIIIGRKTFS